MAIHLYLDEALTQQISEGDFSHPEAESYNGTDGDIKDRQLYVANEQTSRASAIDAAVCVAPNSIAFSRFDSMGSISQICLAPASLAP